MEHLEDLRRMFLKIFLAWGVTSLLAFLLAGRLMAVWRWPLKKMAEYTGAAFGPEFILRSLSPAEVFLVSVKISLLAGFIVSLPVILYLVGVFIFPALKQREKSVLLPSFVVGGGLFWVGLSFAYRVVLPLSLSFFWKYSRNLGIRPDWTLLNYTSFMGTMLCAFGLIFEIPAVILFLAKLGVVNYYMLARRRPVVIVGIFIAAAILTPPDVITQILMVLPMLILFEICLFLSRFAPAGGKSGKR